MPKLLTEVFVAPKDFKGMKDDNGQKLIDIYPDGLFFSFINEPFQILDIQPNDSIYFMQPETQVMKCAEIVND